ncbi:hypothetical protein HQ576_19960 [bacterium]|nr:hypothetical protein [bacterium]
MPAGRGSESFIRVDPRFTAIFTSNPSEYAGVYKAQDALKDRIINIKLGHYDRETEVAITTARSGLAREEAEKVVDLVRAYRTECNGNGRAPSIRASIMIAKILSVYGASAGDPRFVRTCVDVLDSPDPNSNGDIEGKVAQLVAQFAG